jgi:phosphatidylglycerol:prolipoprotein diacylglycerol transferase
MQQYFNIGPLKIHYYGIIIMLGAVMAAWLASREAKRKGLDPEIAWDLFPVVIITGVIGARLWHVFTPSASLVAAGYDTMYYLTHPIAILQTWNGGLGIPGGVIGGVLGLYLYMRKHGQSFPIWLDNLAPGLALAQAIGRWGNFINQELYGLPTDLPWKIYIEPAYRLPGFADVSYYHPTFLYESLWNLLNMAILLWVGRKFFAKLHKGDIFLLYLVIYPVGRFLLEFVRLEFSPVAGININQTVMGVVAISAALALILRHRKQEPKQADETV